jgi:signal transduction histidine kinase
MLEVVWNNLFSNAVKFTGPGGRIFVSLKAVDGFPEGSYAQVSITDSGIGIDAETQKRIFDKFYQGDSSHSQEGNGLGLAMVKRIVGLFGGTIAVESQPGQGSTFTVCLIVQYPYAR